MRVKIRRAEQEPGDPAATAIYVSPALHGTYAPRFANRGLYHEGAGLSMMGRWRVIGKSESVMDHNRHH